MLIDARTLPNEEVVETDICVIGTGPAGMTLAHEFAGQDFRVCFLETGGLKPDDAVQSLSAGEVVGEAYNGLEVSRRRQVGGMANEWSIELNATQRGVRYAVLDEVDFEKRDWLPYSGWCFDRAHLEPYYERAQTISQAGSFTYDVNDWETEQTPKLPLNSSRVHTNMFQFGPNTAFTQDIRDRVIQSSHLTLYTYANAVELETDETAQTVTRVRVACVSGNRFWVAAKFVIVAAGAIESARLLLLSNQTQKTGLGNQHDVVGRFFMDHPFVCAGEFTPVDRQLFNQTTLYDRHQVNNTQVMAKLSLTDETVRREQVLNMSALLFPRYPMYQLEAARALKKVFMTQYKYLMRSSESEGVRASRQLVETLTHGGSPKDVIKELRTIGSGLGDIALAAYRKLIVDPLRPNIPADLARCGWSEWQHKERTFGYFEVWSQTEQSPDPDNRLTLSDRLDGLGYRQAKLHWRWRETDRHHVMRAQDILAEEIARSGLGQLKLYRQGNTPFLMSPTAHHHMGTTRMHVDPKQGVVNEHCQVHGVSNLFIASSAVFPTGGYTNPTLTILALAVRLADRVKTEMKLCNVAIG
jgi:choline dehydrogenase-like flavoprotein